MKNQKTNWWLDAIFFTGFILTFLMDLTGVEIHQWIGIAIGVFIVVHLVMHWRWVVKVVDGFFGKTSWCARVNLIIDSTLVGGFLMILLTGLVISTWLNLTFISYDVWKNVHILTSVATLFLVLVKIVLHWKWIVNTAEKYVFPSRQRVINPLPLQFQLTREQVSRREFLKIGGVVGAASLLGISQLVKLAKAADENSGQQLTEAITEIPANQELTSLDPISGSAAQTNNAIELPTANPTTLTTTLPTAVPAQNQQDSTCRIRCKNKCSFPGRCRKYTDSNNNSKCDLGECV